MDGFFTSYLPEASLLHGDLWSGNANFDCNGRPIVFDPACYYGDRECDLAMTRLFGGFEAGFYEAYQREWPLDDGWRLRVDLYNLYHVLNHFNLFGGNYLKQAESMVNRLLAETGH
jgi:fructosamine-3-kinase